jgi:hypothetical protein
VRVSEGIHTFPEDDGTYGYGCRVCKVVIHGYPTRKFATSGAQRHYAKLEHLIALRDRNESKRWANEVVTILLRLVGIDESEEVRLPDLTEQNTHTRRTFE